MLENYEIDKDDQSSTANQVLSYRQSVFSFLCFYLSLEKAS